MVPIAPGASGLSFGTPELPDTADAAPTSGSDGRCCGAWPTRAAATRATTRTSGHRPPARSSRRSIAEQVTAERVAQYFGHYLTGAVRRWAMPGLSARELHPRGRARRQGRHVDAALRPAGEELRARCCSSCRSSCPPAGTTTAIRRSCGAAAREPSRRRCSSPTAARSPSGSSGPCARMDIASVAVYHALDAGGRAVREADEAVELTGDTPGRRLPRRRGRSSPRASATGAEAVHPGFGFLSENAGVRRGARRRRHHLHRPAAGRDPRDGRQDRVQARWQPPRASRPCRGPTDAVADVEEAVAVADSIGYPVLLKASAGGGGKGMRTASRRRGLPRGLRARLERGARELRRRPRLRRALRRAPAPHRGAGAGRQPRQRRPPRRARVLDPAPLPEGHRGVAVAGGRRRDACTAWARRPSALARAVGYISAGTVEMIADEERRLLLPRDEHPPAGRAPRHRGGDRHRHRRRADPRSPPASRSAFGQDDIVFSGHAIECRVYAEDADAGFLPATGRLGARALPRPAPACASITAWSRARTSRHRSTR